MSKDIVVLAPNGRRQTVHCTPDTIILQVLEDVCIKQGLKPSDYDLKHHNKILDLSTSIRFSNLPNKATLEIVEAEKKRQESNVTIGLQLEDGCTGERRTAEFSPNTSLYSLINSLAPNEFESLQHPTILYMRQEVIGIKALQEKTLRQLGLIKGRAILRLLNKVSEGTQANVSTVYQGNLQSEKGTNTGPGSSKTETLDQETLDAVKVIKKLKDSPHENDAEHHKIPQIETKILNDTKKQSPEPQPQPQENKPNRIEQNEPNKYVNSSDISLATMENLERRLKIEEEVTFLGAQKAIAFMPGDTEEELNDLPDDFYELTVDEVRKLYNELQQKRLELENNPLITSSQRNFFEKQAAEQKLASYKNVVVRVQFPDLIILQGIFAPTDTIEDVKKFIKDHLKCPDKQFHIFTTPFKENLDPKMTLLEAKFVPCVLMHFKWLEDCERGACLKEEVYLKKTSSDAASILASKYRSSGRRKLEDSATTSYAASTSKAKKSKAPKWFKT